MDLNIHKPYVGAYLGIYNPDPDHGKTWQQETGPPAIFNDVRFDAMYSSDASFDNLESDYKVVTTMVNTYTDSIRDFLQTWQDKPNNKYKGKTISLRIDGYDIDHDVETVRGCTKDVLSQIRAQLDQLTQQDLQHRPFIVGITPCRIEGLDKSMAASCDFVNMQRYSGGADTLPDKYLGNNAIQGLDPVKLTYGIEIESSDMNAEENNTIDLIANAHKTIVDGKPVAGVWTWRLGSSNWESENLIQVWLYNTVHGTQKLVKGKVPDLGQVKQDWQKRGGAP